MPLLGETCLCQPTLQVMPVGRAIGPLPQRIVLQQKTTFYAVDGSWIGTSSLRKGEFFRARSAQQPRRAIVSFHAARLVIESVVLVARLCSLFLDGPALGAHGRI